MDQIREFVKTMKKNLPEYDKLATGNPIFKARMQDVGYLDLTGCMALGATGPILRSAGLPHDLRKSDPYCGYETYDFDVPTADTCDSYGRFLVRLEEMRQSLRIVEQCLDRLAARARSWSPTRRSPGPRSSRSGPDGLGNSLDHIKKIMGTSMEALIHHFKLVTEGFRVPAGQAYAAVESPKGELGRARRLRRRHPPLPGPLPRPVLHQPAGHGGDVRGRPGRRRHRRRRVHRPRDGRRRPMTAVRRGVSLGMPAAARARLPGRRPRPAGGGRAGGHRPLPRQPRPRLLPLLHLVQSEEGYVTRTGMRFCAETAGPDHRRGHRGRHLLHDVPAQALAATTRSGVCTNTLCAVMGGDAIFEELQEHLGVGNDETTDGRQGHPGAHRVQRGLRLRPRRDGQLGVLRQPDRRSPPSGWSTT